MALKILVGIVVAVLVGGIAFGFYRGTPSTTDTQTMATSTISTVTIGTAVVHVEVEDTDASREQGLSGRTSLAEGSGMLFVFTTPARYGFWMKDMNFPIDMLFIDASGTIQTIAANASPESYHQNPPEIFRPTGQVTYVLEVPAGYADAHGILIGQRATFK